MYGFLQGIHTKTTIQTVGETPAQYFATVAAILFSLEINNTENSFLTWTVYCPRDGVHFCAEWIHDW